MLTTCGWCFRYLFVCVWMVGISIGIYLCLYARPSLGLEGLWIGLIMGMVLFCVALLLQIVFLDWNKECRRFQYRMRQFGDPLAANTNTNNNVSSNSSTVTSTSTHSHLNANQSILYLNEIAIPNIANMAIGGFQIHPRTIEEEMNELEHMEQASLHDTNDLEDSAMEETQNLLSSSDV